MPYKNPWLFNGKPFTDDDIQDSVGFVYIITDRETGKFYVGRKYFYSHTKERKAKRRSKKPSDWKDYYSSSPELKADIEKFGKERFERRILSLHKTRGDVNINEVKEQFRRNVLEANNCYNGNINGKWHRPPLHIIEARRYHD